MAFSEKGESHESGTAVFLEEESGTSIALIVDNKIVVAPEIMAEIPDVSFVISDKFS